MSKYCVNCGDGLPQGADICHNCGMPVSEVAPPRRAPAPQAPAQSPPPPPPPAEESVPPFWQPQQGQSLVPSQPTPPSSLPDEDQNGTEQRQGVSRWVTRTVGFVGTATTALVGMLVFWRRGTDALERRPDTDSDMQQDMGVSGAPVQDPTSSEQTEANLGPIDEVATDAAATEPVGPELALDPSLTDPDAPGPTLEVGLIEQVEKIPELVNVVNRNPELVDAINEDPEFLELCQRYPEFLELCQRYPDFLYLCYHYPHFIELCYQHPHFIQLCYEYPQFIDICYEHPQLIHVCHKYPDFFEKHPEIVEMMEDNPTLVDLMEQKPALLDTLEQTPDLLEQIDENPDVIDAIEQDPALIGRMQKDPDVLDELVTTAAEPQPSPDDEPTKTDSGKLTLDPKLFDPTAPGPTLDTGLVTRIEQNPELVEAVNQNEDVARALEKDPTSVEQIEQDLGLAEGRPVEPSGITEPAGVTEPEVTEVGTPDQDLDDQPSS